MLALPNAVACRTRTVLRIILLLILTALSFAPTVVLADDLSINNHLGDVCLAVADERTLEADPDDQQDTLTLLDPKTGNTTVIGTTGTVDIEALTFGPALQLYAADAGQLGTLDVTTGAFTSLPLPFGAAGGSEGEILLDNVDGLAFSLPLNILFGMQRRPPDGSGIGVQLDLLFAIDPTTGAHLPDYFGPEGGPKTDYVVVPALLDEENNSATDVDDIQFNPVTNNLYGVMNTDGNGSVLATIDILTGVPTYIAMIRDESNDIIDDIEGISFSNHGTLYASTGDNFDLDLKDLNKLFEIDPVSGLGTLVGPFPPGLKDYEGVGCFSNEAAIVLRKYTNGPEKAPDDADTPTGPFIPQNATVTWTYVFTNTSVLTLTQLSLADDKLGMIGPKDNSSCLPTGTVLGPGQSLTCTATGIASAGQYANIATITGTSEPSQLYPVQTVSDTNPSHYFGVRAEIAIKKYTNGEDADVPTGPLLLVGGDVLWTYVVINTGNVPLTAVAVTDDQGVTVSCPKVELAVGEGMLCTATGIAQLGQYANVGTVVGTPPVGTQVTDDDPSHYFGITKPPASLGDRVWDDLNENGVQDIGEPGVNGVRVRLFNSENVQVGETTTSNGGIYAFTNLMPASYYVVFDPTTLPVESNFTIQNQGTDELDSDADQNGKTPAVTLVAGQIYLDLDAGIVRPAQPELLGTLGDRVWFDTNVNGLQDDGETGVANVKVDLYTETGTLVKTDTTDLNGGYLFTKLPAGSYYVEFVRPRGLNFTRYNVNNNGSDAIDSDPLVPTVTLGVTDEDKKGRLGRELTYTLFYTNSDPLLSANNIVISTTVPVGTSLVITDANSAWSCTQGNSGGICTLMIPTMPANTVASPRFIVLVDNDNESVPEEIELVASLTHATGTRTSVVTLSIGETNLTVDAGIVRVVARQQTRKIDPSALPPTSQPDADVVIFLPSVLTQE